jgi:hypothetical protein
VTAREGRRAELPGVLVAAEVARVREQRLQHLARDVRAREEDAGRRGLAEATAQQRQAEQGDDHAGVRRDVERGRGVMRGDADAVVAAERAEAVEGGGVDVLGRLDGVREPQQNGEESRTRSRHCKHL